MIKKVRKLLLVLLGFSMHMPTLQAGNDTLFFKHYSIEQGLSHNDVTSIIQDSLGFMWYGTKSGLNKFDGYSFIAYKHDPKNKNSLVNDDITCMSVDRSGIIWIGTRMKGINKLDPYTGIFTSYQHKPNDRNSLNQDEVTTVHVDTATHWVWIGTASKGMNAFDPFTGRFISFRQQPGIANSLSHDAITRITADRAGRLWIGTRGGGISVYDQRRKRFMFYRHDANNSASLPSDDVRDIFIDRDQQVWIATSAGLCVLNPVTNQVRIFRHDPNNRYSICSNDITSVYQDKDGKIWAGTSQHGLNVYYPATQKFFLYSREENSQYSLNSNRINTISQGRSGMFWAATKDGGLNAFNPRSLKFKLHHPFLSDADQSANEKITMLYQTSNNRFFIGTKGLGMFSYQLGSGRAAEGCGAVKNRQVNAIVEKDPTHLFIASETGLYCLDLNTYRSTVIKNPGPVVCLYFDRHETLWMGTAEKGLFSLNLRTGAFTGYPQLTAASSITCITMSKSGILWIGTYGSGLISYNPRNGSHAQYKNDPKDVHSPGSNYINCITEDKGGNIWISTWGGGLNTYMKTKNNFTCFSTQDGLPSNSIGQILPDDNNNLWIGTDHGIYRISIHNYRITQCRVFDMTDGLPTLEFYNSTAMRSHSGQMIFSCKKGIISFHPDSLRNNPYKPPVIITDLQVFNRSVLPGDSTGILTSAISVTNEIHLSYKQNVFSFEFTAMSFINAGKNRYAYKMEGFDRDWIYTDANKRIATYTNLAPGTYTFRVKASNNTGTWNEHGTSLRVIIAAPYYRTAWFIALCMALLSLLIYGLYRYRVNQLLTVERIRSRISRDLHDEIGSTLSSINIWSEMAKENGLKKSDGKDELIRNISRSSQEILDSMDDIVWSINPVNDSMVEIGVRMRQFVSTLLEPMQINIHFDLDEKIYNLKLSMQQRSDIYLIFKEAVNNLVKYSHCTNVWLKLGVVDRRLYLSVKDDGIGFDEATLEPGNGLHNMRKRATDLHARVSIVSTPGAGTEVILEKL